MEPRTTVTGFLLELASGAGIGRLTRFNVSPGKYPQARIRNRLYIIAMLQKSSAVAADEHDADNDVEQGFFRGG